MKAVLLLDHPSEVDLCGENALLPLKRTGRHVAARRQDEAAATAEEIGLGREAGEACPGRSHLRDQAAGLGDGYLTIEKDRRGLHRRDVARVGVVPAVAKVDSPLRSPWAADLVRLHCA